MKGSHFCIMSIIASIGFSFHNIISAVSKREEYRDVQREGGGRETEKVIGY